MAAKRAKLNEKIKYIKRTFQTPYHFFYAGTKSSLVGLRFEDKQGRHFEFTAPSMFTAVLTAENYVMTEIKEGNLADPDIETKEQKHESE